MLTIYSVRTANRSWLSHVFLQVLFLFVRSLTLMGDCTNVASGFILKSCLDTQKFGNREWLFYMMLSFTE